MLLLLAQQLAEHLGFRGNELDEEGVCEEADGQPVHRRDPRDQRVKRVLNSPESPTFLSGISMCCQQGRRVRLAMKRGLPPLRSRRTKAKQKEGNGGSSQTMSAEPSETRKLSLSALTG